MTASSTVVLQADPTTVARRALVAARGLSAARGGVLSRYEAEACGLSRAQVVTLVRRGEWVRVRRGFFVPSSSAPPELLAARQVLATLRHRHGGRADLSAKARWVAGRETAAAVHGLPLIVPAPRGAVLLDRGLSPLLPEHVVVLCGVPVTSLARTVADLARKHGRWQGIVAGDVALRLGATPAALRAAAEHGAGWRGAPAARLVAEAARPKAESPLESVGRLRIVELGYPEPELQVDVMGSDGFAGRADQLWRDQMVVAEADGLSKYRGVYARKDDAGPVQVLEDEKLREDALRDAGAEVARYTWVMAMHRPALLDARLRNAFERAARRAA